MIIILKTKSSATNYFISLKLLIFSLFIIRLFVGIKIIPLSFCKDFCKNNFGISHPYLSLIFRKLLLI